MALFQLADEEHSSSTEISLDYRSVSGRRSWRHPLTVDEKQSVQSKSKKNICKKQWYHIPAFLLVLGFIAILIWLSLALSLPRRAKFKAPSNRASSIVDNWITPKDSTGLLSPWNSSFTQGITPLPCHSHNDYWRSVPLFEALAAGCTGVEADIYLPTKTDSKDLLVGHTPGSLTQDRTLENLYIEPLLTILENLNNVSALSDERARSWNGIFQSSPNTTLSLLLDFKSNGTELWPFVNQHLQTLRSKNWLTHWSSSTGITWAPIIVVATGDAPFNLLNFNVTYRDIFYDAPLDDISNPIYNNTNSYYASVSMSHTLGKQWLWKFNSVQLKKISAQTSAANEKGLKARYWDTPTWPVSFRDYIMRVLIENGMGMLNVDTFSSGLYFPLMTKFGQNRLVW